MSQDLDARNVPYLRRARLDYCRTDRALTIERFYSNLGLSDLHVPERGVDWNARWMLESERDCLRRADLYYYDRDLCGLVDDAVRDMPDWTPRLDDFPSLHGLAVFGGPPHVNDEIRLEPIPISAITWSAVDDGLRPVDAGGDPRDAAGMFLRFYTLPDPRNPENHSWPAGTLMPLDELVTRLDGTLTLRLDEGQYPRIHLARWTACAFTLARQSDVAEHHAHVPERAERRRHEKAGLPAPTVRVNRLAPAGSSPTVAPGTGTPLTERQQVRGHWKNVWHPSTQTHTRQYIRPYERGPEDGPRFTGERITRLAPPRDRKSRPSSRGR